MNDAIIPYGLKISEGTRHVMASMVIRSISKEIKDTNIVKELQWAGGEPANGGDLKVLMLLITLPFILLQITLD